MFIKKLVLLLAALAATCAGAETGNAQATRTWVSGTGTDNSNCSRTEPCQLFSQALAVTANYGEIDCLDPGGFGTLTIAIPVTINCEGVSAAGVQATVSGAIGINITATGPVSLIGLDINGTNQALNGVSITSAAQVKIGRAHV